MEMRCRDFSRSVVLVSVDWETVSVPHHFLEGGSTSFWGMNIDVLWKNDHC